VGGKIVRVSTNTDSKATAKLRLPDIRAEERKKTERANPSLTNVKTFGDALDVLERRINNAVKLRPGARRDNFDNIRRIKATWPGIEKVLLRDLNTDGILDWAKRLHEKYSATSYNNTIGMFRRVIIVGIEAGAITRDPMMGGDGKRLVERVAPPPKQLALPNDEQWQAILAEAGRNVGFGGRGTGWRIRFLAYTGARLQEARGYSEHEVRRLANYGGADPQQATGVRKRDVDLTRNMIRLYGKGGKERWVPLLAEARELIEEIFAARPKMKADDRLMTVMECPETLARCCKEAGCQRLTHHDLRHFFATRLIEMGIDTPTVAKMLGHADGGAGHESLWPSADGVPPEAITEPSLQCGCRTAAGHVAEFRSQVEHRSDRRCPNSARCWRRCLPRHNWQCLKASRLFGHDVHLEEALRTGDRIGDGDRTAGAGERAARKRPSWRDHIILELHLILLI
jgi:integrase